MNKNYPWQAASIKRMKKVLGVDAQLYAPTEEDSASPLELHSGFSRFLVTIVDKSGETTVTPKANIPCRDIDAIKLKTDIAMQNYLVGNSQVDPSESSEFVNSPAYTQQLAFGSYKGKTPAEILIDDPKEKDNLLKQKDFLQKNAEKFPANKKQIVAIDDAVKLLEIGELSASVKPAATANSSVISIYKTEYKHFSQKNERGDSLIYSISIIYDKTKNYPFICEISNCFAPVEILPGGQHRPIMSKATNLAKSSMAMSDTEWVSLITHLTKLKEYFELTNFRPMLNMAENCARQNAQNNNNG